MTLVEVLQQDATRRAVVEDGAVMIQEEVQGKGGFSGRLVKGGYRAVKAIRPGIIEASLDMLLPRFAPVLDPFYAEAKTAGSVESYFTTHRSKIAEALLTVTDDRAKVAKNRVMKKSYGALRPQAKKHVEEAMPRLARLLTKHVG